MITLMLAFTFLASALIGGTSSVSAEPAPRRYLDTLFQEVEVSTHTYATYEGQPYALDIYQSAGDTAGARLFVLYVHGGGFSGGRRDGDNLKAWARDLAHRGYVVGSMSYRLTMRGRSFHCDQPAPNKILTFQRAAEDIRACTGWLLDRASTLRLDPEGLVLAGSSAGAEAILHAGFWSREDLLPESPELPAGFAYAGLISMAGALVDSSLITRANAVPIQLFHGTCDNLVPYGSAPHHYCPEDTPGALPLDGAASIARRYRHLGRPYQLITVCQGGHEWASRPLTHGREEILDFLYHDVWRGRVRQIHLMYRRGEACDLGGQPAICAD